MAQAAVVAAAPGVQLPLGSDGSAVRAPTCDVHHVLARLLARERRDGLGLLQGPVRRKGRNANAPEELLLVLIYSRVRVLHYGSHKTVLPLAVS